MNVIVKLKTIAAGREELAPGHSLPRHRHLDPYAIVVVRGRFDQVGYAGRISVSAGDLLIQPTLDTHSNHMPRGLGATIVRLPWSDPDDLGGVFALSDLDAIVRAAERDVREAAELARAQCERGSLRGRPLRELPDALAADIAGGRVSKLERWSERVGLARETVSREFSAAFETSAREFRAELQAREAWLRIVRTRDPLAAIAASTGFADQAHMTRRVARLTGAPPAAWRRDRRAARFLRLPRAARD